MISELGGTAGGSDALGGEGILDGDGDAGQCAEAFAVGAGAVDGAGLLAGPVGGEGDNGVDVAVEPGDDSPSPVDLPAAVERWQMDSTDRTDVATSRCRSAALMADSERRAIQSRVKRACRDRIGPIGLSLDAKALQQASTQSRQKSAIDWANSIGLKEEIINAGVNLKRPTLENLCYWLNGKGKLTRRGSKWTSGSLHQQLKRFGWSLKELLTN